jgi:hypothetical protein
MKSSMLILIMWLTACKYESQEQADARRAHEAWIGPCSDNSVLLATTSGSPSQFTCPNREHRMRVQVATNSSNEEAAALVFCECRRPNEK